MASTINSSHDLYALRNDFGPNLAVRNDLRAQSRDLYSRIQRQVNVQNNVQHPDLEFVGINRFDVCAFSGHTSKDESHIFPRSDAFTVTCERWMIAQRWFSPNARERQREKMQASNLINLFQTLARGMEPDRGWFCLGPSLDELHNLCRFGERALKRAETSQSHFGQFDFKAEFFRGWPHQLEGFDINTFEYRAFTAAHPSALNITIFNMIDGLCTPTQHRMQLTSRLFPVSYNENLPVRRYALHPFNVIYMTWFTLNRIQWSDRDFPGFTLDMQRYLKLCDYYLRLLEVGTPSEFRTLDRPTLPFPLPEITPETVRNVTSRFDQSARVTRSGRRYFSGGSASTSSSSREARPALLVTSPSLTMSPMTPLEEQRGTFPSLNELLAPLSPGSATSSRPSSMPSLTRSIATLADSEVLSEINSPNLNTRGLHDVPESMMEDDSDSENDEEEEEEYSRLPWGDKVSRMQARIDAIDRELEGERKALCIEAFGIDEQITGPKLTALRYSYNPSREATMVKLHDERENLVSTLNY